MSIFEDFGKKLTSAGQAALQKTQEFANSARIKSLIAEEEKKLDRYYCQIGMLYVSKHPSDYESDFEATIKAINDAKNNISAYKDQIESFNKKTVCKKCGAEISGDADFCKYCGTPVRGEPTPESGKDTVKCPNCGAEMKKGAVFCNSCGQLMPH